MHFGAIQRATIQPAGGAPHHASASQPLSMLLRHLIVAPGIIYSSSSTPCDVTFGVGAPAARKADALDNALMDSLRIIHYLTGDLRPVRRSCAGDGVWLELSCKLTVRSRSWPPVHSSVRDKNSHSSVGKKSHSSAPSKFVCAWRAGRVNRPKRDRSHAQQCPAS